MTEGAEPRDAIQPGTIIGGRYKLGERLGEGGMGLVFAAVHLGLGQPVAVKVLSPGARSSPEVVARFLREARAAVGLSGEHTVRVLDVGTLDGSGAPYMVMERLNGCDLSQYLAERGPLPVTEAVDLTLQACQALAEAHASGIVHRDLKPANLFLTRRADGSALVKVLDFGISKVTGPENVSLTTTQALLGSPLYMSPEQICSPRDTDSRADIWAVGIVLQELLSGSVPFHGETVHQLTARIVTQAPRPLSVDLPGAPPELEAAILRCVAKAPADRFQDVAALAAVLASFASPEGKRVAERVARICESRRGGTPAAGKTTAPSTGMAPSAGAARQGAAASPRTMVAPVVAAVPEPARPASPAKELRGAATSSGPRVALVVSGAVALVALAGGALWWLGQTRGADDGAPDAGAVAPSSPAAASGGAGTRLEPPTSPEGMAGVAGAAGTMGVAAREKNAPDASGRGPRHAGSAEDATRAREPAHPQPAAGSQDADASKTEGGQEPATTSPVSPPPPKPFEPANPGRWASPPSKPLSDPLRDRE